MMLSRREALRYRSGLGLLVTSLIGYVPSQVLRRQLYLLLGMKIEPGAVVYAGAEVRSPRGIKIGRGSMIGSHAVLDGRRGIDIGANVNLSNGVWIWTLQHSVDDPFFGVDGGPVKIGDRAWVSCRVVVLPGVSIGRGAVVAAGAVVTRDIPEYAIAAGVPAKVVGSRNRDLQYELTGKSVPFV